MQLLMDIIGWTGSGMILLAYSLTLLKNKKYHRYGKYINLLAGLFIAINCYYYNAIPPFVTNLLWSFIATITIYKNKVKKECTNKKSLT